MAFAWSSDLESLGCTGRDGEGWLGKTLHYVNMHLYRNRCGWHKLAVRGGGDGGGGGGGGQMVAVCRDRSAPLRSPGHLFARHRSVVGRAVCGLCSDPRVTIGHL